MAQVKNINLLLLEGNPLGRIKCTIGNWIGVAYKIPRDEIERCKDRADLKNSGVYFLFGDANDIGKPVVYIGQAGNRKNGEGILNRLIEHNKNSDKDYWQEAVILTTSNNSLDLTGISFLENKFCNLAIDAKRYEVKNSNDPSPGHITEEKESELDEFAEYVRIVMLIFGYKIFEPIIEVPHYDNDENTPTLYLKRSSKALNITINAKGRKVTNGFIVLAGSQVSPEEDAIIGAKIKKARRTAKISKDNILLEDMFLETPSGAAEFVVGKPINGWEYWKTKDGVSLGEFAR